MELPVFPALSRERPAPDRHRQAFLRKIAGIAPLCVHDVRRFAWLVRVVDTIVAEIGDYRNILVHPAHHRGQVVAAVLGYLHEKSELWDVIDISQLCSRDPTTFHVVNVAQSHIDWSVRVQTLTPVAVRRLKARRVAEIPASSDRSATA